MLEGKSQGTLGTLIKGRVAAPTVHQKCGGAALASSAFTRIHPHSYRAVSVQDAVGQCIKPGPGKATRATERRRMRTLNRENIFLGPMRHAAACAYAQRTE